MKRCDVWIGTAKCSCCSPPEQSSGVQAYLRSIPAVYMLQPQKEPGQRLMPCVVSNPDACGPCHVHW